MPRTAAHRPTVRRLLRHRRPLAALLLALAVVLGLSALRQPPAPTTRVVVTVRDLVAGATLSASDVHLEPWPTTAVPGGALTAVDQAVGHRTAGAVRVGEALTDVRLLTADDVMAGTSGGDVAVPVRLSDASVGGLLEPGTVVDVIAADARGSARVVAEAAEVVSIPDGAPSADTFDGVLVVLSVPPATATELAAAAAVGPLSVSLRG